ncbi:RHS repeat-associated core domain-containing protein [Actinoplanes sp. RD1]|uniref:RHS repeat-associated core domain-containing protein n=1 Tax=Actinoplanes sp. RD1 TaxID=3064538 RepID=UPI00274092D0|nr:RHS repeat-associated core domain-containing protein [Actinoplanes sp. RD1]
MATVVLTASSLIGVGGSPASAEEVPSAAAVIEPVFSPKTGDKVWLYTSPARNAVASTAAVADPPSVPKGTGPVRGATQVSFSLTDRLDMKVNVGSGNLLLTSTELTLPGIAGNTTLGASFNSLLLGTNLPNGSLGPGWRSRSGADVRLYEATSDGSVTYAAADGVVGKFTKSGSGYTAPGVFKASLAKDGSGWKLTEHDSGKELFFTADGVLDKTEDRNGNVTDYTYSGANWATVVSDKGTAPGKTVEVGYTDGKISRYRQWADGSTSRTATYAYDSSGRLQNIQSTSYRSTSFEYSSAGDLTRITTDADDTRVDITYDGQHRVTSVNQVTVNATGEGSMTRFAYTSSTQTDVADPRQNLSQPVTSVPHTTYTVDDQKRVTKTVDPAGNERSDTYTPFSDVASSVSPEGGTVTNTYGANAGESLTKSASPSGSSASAAYANAATSTNPTANFQPSSSIDTQGNSSSYTYNGAGNQTSAKDALAAEAKVDYNDDGTVKKSTDPGNDTNGTTYTYDANKQLTKLTPPTGSGLPVKTFTYDAYGRLSTATAGSCTTTYTYDTQDRQLTSEYSGTSCPSTTTVTFQYGAGGNLLTRTDATGTTTWQYDQLNRMRIRTAPNTPVQTYRPDPAGNLEQLIDGRGTTKYYYNTRNWLVRLDTAGGTRYNFTYDKSGNRTHTYFAANDTNSTWALHTQTTYDKSDRPTRITSTRDSVTPVKVFDTTYCYAKYVSGQACSTAKDDDTGLRQWQKDEIAGTVSEFSHDKGNRLTKATNYAGSTYEYTYDTNGNRKTVVRAGTTTQSLAYNSGNQITTTGNTYDARGNQTRVTEPEIGTLQYNAANQMTYAYGPGGSADYTYAGTDQVELATAGTFKLNYGMEDQHGMAWLQSWTNGNNQTVYVERDGLGTPLGLRVGTTDYAYVQDGLGSIVAVVGSNKTVAATYTYDPYGTVQSTSTETALGQTNIIRYAAGTYDPYTRLTRYGQRWYDPNQGRFTQQDSLSFIGDPSNGNRYAYAGANPVNYTDPTGNFPPLKDFTENIGAGAGASAFLGLLVVGGCVTLSVACVAGGFVLGSIGATLGGMAGSAIGGGTREDVADAGAVGLLTGPFAAIF